MLSEGYAKPIAQQAMLEANTESNSAETLFPMSAQGCTSSFKELHCNKCRHNRSFTYYNRFTQWALGIRGGSVQGHRHTLCTLYSVDGPPWQTGSAFQSYRWSSLRPFNHGLGTHGYSNLQLLLPLNLNSTTPLLLHSSVLQRQWWWFIYCFQHKIVRKGFYNANKLAPCRKRAHSRKRDATETSANSHRIKCHARVNILDPRLESSVRQWKICP